MDTMTRDTNRRAKSSSTAAVCAALVGDVLVAISKAGAAIWTGSARRDERGHSLDRRYHQRGSVGMQDHRSRQKADIDHPFGYGENYIFGASWCHS